LTECLKCCLSPHLILRRCDCCCCPLHSCPSSWRCLSLPGFVCSNNFAVQRKKNSAHQMIGQKAGMERDARTSAEWERRAEEKESAGGMEVEEKEHQSAISFGLMCFAHSLSACVCTFRFSLVFHILIPYTSDGSRNHWRWWCVRLSGVVPDCMRVWGTGLSVSALSPESLCVCVYTQCIRFCVRECSIRMWFAHWLLSKDDRITSSRSHIVTHSIRMREEEEGFAFHKTQLPQTQTASLNLLPPQMCVHSCAFRLMLILSGFSAFSLSPSSIPWDEMFH
jgi:hypothetical protein